MVTKDAKDASAIRAAARAKRALAILATAPEARAAESGENLLLRQRPAGRAGAPVRLMYCINSYFVLIISLLREFAGGPAGEGPATRR